MEKRMDYYHSCSECGREFQGFKKQHTCWSCIGIWVEVQHKLGNLPKGEINDKN